MKKLLFILLTAASCAAHAYSSNTLFEDCKLAESEFTSAGTDLPKHSPQGERCINYIDGFADGYTVGNFLADKVGVKLNAFCLPKTTDLTLRMVRAVVIHIGHAPPGSTASSSTLVAGALAKTFPCAD